MNRIERFLFIGMECPYFFITKDNEWAFKHKLYYNQRLSSFTLEELYDIFELIEENEPNLKTQINLKEIKENLK